MVIRYCSKVVVALAWYRLHNDKILSKLFNDFCFINQTTSYFMLSDFFFYFLVEVSRGAAARSVTVKPIGCGFDPHLRRWNIYLNVYFHFFALVSRLSAALSSATQHAMPPKFGRNAERSVLTLGSLCLTCCVRDKKKIINCIDICLSASRCIPKLAG